MNLDFEIDNIRFNARASAIIYNKDKTKVLFELCSIQENFLEKDNKKIMQYCFCYKSIYNKDINQESFICKDNKGQIFYWVNINDLQNYKLLPNSTYKLIKDSENIRHIIER